MNEIVVNLGLSFLTALAGAYGGARAATLWQERKEKNEFKCKREAAIVNALILCRHYGEVIEKIRKKINSDNRKLEWYEVNLVEIFMPSPLVQNAAELVSLLGKDQHDLVGSVVHAEWVALSALTISDRRDREYLGVQKFLIEKGSPRRLTEQQAKNILGEPWAVKLDSITKELHVAVDAAINQNKECFHRLAVLLPRDKDLSGAFERIEPTLSI